jgi:hypothetical protein
MKTFTLPLFMLASLNAFAVDISDLNIAASSPAHFITVTGTGATRLDADGAYAHCEAAKSRAFEALNTANKVIIKIDGCVQYGVIRHDDAGNAIVSATIRFF